MANVVITGASRGLGLAMAREMASRGHRVFGGTRSDASLGEGIEKFELDVCDEERVKQVISNLARNRHIDILINNAGVYVGGPLALAREDDFKHVLDVNLLGAWRVTRAALPFMKEGGCIAMISSLSGLLGTAEDGLYAASKFALEGMSESLAEELKISGLRVALIEPGAIATGFGGFQHGVAPNALAHEIADILASPSGQLRYPVGEQAAKIAERIGLDRRMTSERLES